MGSWGTELDANDTARDALQEFSKEIILARKNPSQLVELFSKVRRRYGSDAVLGIGWVLLNRKVSLEPIKALLLGHLKRELGEKKLRQWSGQEERKHNLLSFQYRLEGKPAPRAISSIKQKFPRRQSIKV